MYVGVGCYSYDVIVGGEGRIIAVYWVDRGWDVRMVWK